MQKNESRGGCSGQLIALLKYMSMEFIYQGFLPTPWMVSTIQSIGIALLIFLFFWLISRYAARFLSNLLGRMVAWNDTLSGSKLMLTLERPLRFLFVLVGLYIALRYLPLPIVVEDNLIKVFRSLVIIFVAWVLYDMADTGSLFSQGVQDKLKLDSIILAFFSRVTRFSIAALAIVMAIQEWGYNVNGLIAGLGLGGLALALAAREALANVVAGIVLIVEKPFLIGDWISTPSAEGTVEDISFRSTRVRSSNQSLTTIPNSTLASQAITNHARLGKRKLEFILSLPVHSKRQTVERLISQIQEILRSHPEVETETSTVVLQKIAKDSLELMIHCLVANIGWEDYMRVQEEINLAILELMQQFNQAE